MFLHVILRNKPIAILTARMTQFHMEQPYFENIKWLYLKTHERIFFFQRNAVNEKLLEIIYLNFETARLNPLPFCGESSCSYLFICLRNTVQKYTGNSSCSSKYETSKSSMYLMFRVGICCIISTALVISTKMGLLAENII